MKNRDANQQMLLELNPVTHAQDPLPSHVAEERITKSGNRKRNTLEVAACVKVSPGLTAVELFEKSKAFTRHEWSRRLPDAVKLGLVKKGEQRKCTVNGNLMTTWWPVEQETTS